MSAQYSNVKRENTVHITTIRDLKDQLHSLEVNININEIMLILFQGEINLMQSTLMETKNRNSSEPNIAETIIAQQRFDASLKEKEECIRELERKLLLSISEKNDIEFNAVQVKG